MVIHSSEAEHRLKDGKEALEGGRSPENLPLLYQGLLTGIVRIQSRRQRITEAESFRRRTKATLEEIERFAAAAGYESQYVRDTHFAVVAFLDSVILHSSDPVTAEWARQTLQEELFGQTDAGVVFFEKLARLLAQRDSTHLADILEVYLLCLLLGFEGRYSGALRSELDVITEKVRRRIDDIRGECEKLAPRIEVQTGPAPPSEPRPRSKYLRLGAVCAVLFTLALFLLMLWNLAALSSEVRARLL
jgi:type VI secretion system protein ImpK